MQTSIAESFLEFGKSLIPSNRYSQNGEDGILEGIFDKIGTANKWCVEVGASDGLFMSNTRKLIEEGWNSLQIEGDPDKFARLQKQYDANQSSGLLRGKVVTHLAMIEPSGPNSLDQIMGAIPEIPSDLDLLSIDVDGQDYYIFNGLLKYRPRVVICEFNPNSNPEFIPELGGPGQAGMIAIQRVMVAHGYAAIVATTYNLIGIRLDIVREKLTDAEVPKVKRQIAVGPKQSLDDDTSDRVSKLLHIKDPVSGDQALVKAAVMLSMGRLSLSASWGCIQSVFGSSGLDLNMLKLQGGLWGQQVQRGLNYLIEEGCNWIFALDHDSIFTLEDAQELLRLAVRYPDADAIVPWQVKRGGWKELEPGISSGPAIVGVRGQDGKLSNQIHTGYFSGDLVPITMGHFGFTLIKLDSIKDIPKPWLLSVPGPDGEWDEGHVDDDVYFWQKMVDNGRKVYLANNVRVGHIDETVLWFDSSFRIRHQAVPDYFKDGRPQLYL